MAAFPGGGPVAQRGFSTHMALTDKQLSELARQLDARRAKLSSEVHEELAEPERREFGTLTGAFPGTPEISLSRMRRRL